MKGDKTLAEYLKACPRLLELAMQLCLRLHFRDGALWAEDVQLGYEYHDCDGKRKRLATIEQKCELAVELLDAIKSARASWGSLLDRARSIIAQFEKECVKPFNIRRMHWTIIRDNSLDSVAVFGGSSFEPRGAGFTVTLSLIGESQLEASGKSLREATDNLLSAAEQKYKFQRKSQKATRPFNSDDELKRLTRLMGSK